MPSNFDSSQPDSFGAQIGLRARSRQKLSLGSADTHSNMRYSTAEIEIPYSNISKRPRFGITENNSATDLSIAQASAEDDILQTKT